MATSAYDISLTSGASTQTIDAGITAIYVKNQSTSAGKVLVTIHGLCTDAPIEPGDSQPFRVGTGGINNLSLRSNTTATANWGACANV